jgi:hypothetical protein
MGLQAQKRGCYTVKSYQSYQYSWCPDTSEKRGRTNAGGGMNQQNNKFYCTATPNSQGQDWITTYVYNLAVNPSGVQQRIAYVECDYVL